MKGKLFISVFMSIFLIMFLGIGTMILNDSMDHFNWLMETESRFQAEEIGGFIATWLIIPSLIILCLISLGYIWREYYLMCKKK